MGYLWRKSEKLAAKLGMDEIKLFIIGNTIGCACLFLIGFIFASLLLDWGVNATLGVGGVCTILSGGVIGLFGSVFWMIRNE